MHDRFIVFKSKLQIVAMRLLPMLDSTLMANYLLDASSIQPDRSRIGFPTGKAGQIASLLEQRLTLGYYDAGQKLSFQQIAEEFNVSRQPVSVAISHLRASGYLEVSPQVGCHVVRPKASEVIDFFMVLSKLESCVVRMACSRHKDGEAQLLQAIKPAQTIDSLDKLVSRTAYIQYIDKYHDFIWKMAKTPLLEYKLSSLRKLSNFFLWQGNPSVTHKAALKLTNERNDIAIAIASRNADIAEKLMEKHIVGKLEAIDLI
ncbi:transcriptional regulator [Spongiibacter sp. IMCC21906]|nr:transcriptional regulator [Spongiibacter sp. IMCC21906]